MKKVSQLGKILKILQDVPREKILRDLSKGSGWSYHGPHQKLENKVGPGRYLDPIVKIDNKNLQDEKYWFYYPLLPRYEILCFIPSKPSVVMTAALSAYGVCGYSVDNIESILDNDIHRLTVRFKDGEIIELEAEDELSLSYKFYLEALYEQEVMLIPSLRDLKYVEDINESYSGDPTIVYESFPAYLNSPQFERYYDYSDLGKCVGKLRLVEGTFWIVTNRFYVPPNKRLSIKTDKATHVGGCITRVGS